MTELLWIGLGLGALVAGAEGVVAGGRAGARRLGVSDLAVGLVVASVGTSLPELFTAASAARSAVSQGEQAAAIGMGNILGSNLFLLLFLFGVMGARSPVDIDGRIWRRDGMALLLATGALVALSLDGVIAGWEGLVLLAGFAMWLGLVAYQEREVGPVTDERPSTDPRPAWQLGGMVVGGLVALGLGADLVVDRGVVLAARFGIDAVLVGVLAGFGTSLPEVVVSLRAGTEDPAMSLGNILGSALTNALLCTGVAASLGSLLVPADALTLELPFLAAGTVVMLLLTWERRDLSRAEGLSLLTLFGLYVTLRLVA